MRATIPENTLPIIDLFCGCGGFSLGARYAGFNSVLSVDIDPILSSAYRLNFPTTNVQNLDLSKTTGTELLEAAGVKEVFGMIGGPPCQGFSSMGRRDENDPRNELIGHYFKQVMEVRPKFFVMENVPGLLSGPMRSKLDIQLKIVTGTYEIVGPVIVSAAKLGAATRRERVIVIGYLKEEFEAFNNADILSIQAELASVASAISDVPGPVTAVENDYGWAKFDRRRKQSSYAKFARALPPPDIGNETAKQRLSDGFVSGLHDTIHSAQVAARYAALRETEKDIVSKAVRLSWSGLCPTLRAGTGPERGSHQAVRPIHPAEGRVITVREAARMQGFPDWFLFHTTKWHSFRMIGNSVSPYLSYGLLNFIRSRIKRDFQLAA